MGFFGFFFPFRFGILTSPKPGNTGHQDGTNQAELTDSILVEARGSRFVEAQTIKPRSPLQEIVPEPVTARTLAYDLERSPPVSTNRHF